jgi:hypothetical protein
VALMRRIREFALVLSTMWVLGGALACTDDSVAPPPARDPSCTGFYGQPNANTGLDAQTCFPRIEGVETWTPRAWDAAAFASLRSWKLDTPPALMTESPYAAAPTPKPSATAVCAVKVTGDKTYRLMTFEEESAVASIAAAVAAGTIVTHGGACGACSSLEDLEVYARIPDQTEPVRKCSTQNLGGTIEELDACIQKAVGFSAPCTRAWSYNAKNDSELCLAICFKSLIDNESYNLADGSLNGCLQCDEDVSGPVFKATAGRTRRNSGLASAICRPCETVWRIDHRYE